MLAVEAVTVLIRYTVLVVKIICCGGSAGSMYGAGWKGGDGAGMVSVGHPGGAIGGPGGFGGSSNTTTPWYDGSSGSGGGSYGPGISGGCGDSSGVQYGYGGANSPKVDGAY